MTTHRPDTIVKVPGNGLVDYTKPNLVGIYTIKDGNIENVHKMRALLRMTANLRDLIDFHPKVYTESTTDARFYEGAYRSLKKITDKYKEAARTLSDSVISDDEKKKFLSDRYQPSFYSVSEGGKKDGGCKKVRSSIESAQTSYKTLAWLDGGSSEGYHEQWKATRKVFIEPALYKTYGIVDSDYGTTANLKKGTEESKEIDESIHILKKRHSLDNFTFDPIIFCSVLTLDEILEFVNQCRSIKEESSRSSFISVCMAIQECLRNNEHTLLQKHVDEYCKVILDIMQNNFFRNPNNTDEPVLEEIPSKEPTKQQKKNLEKHTRKSHAFKIYSSLKTKCSEGSINQYEGLEPTIYLTKDGQRISIYLPSEFLEIRGHDFEERFLGEKNTIVRNDKKYNPTDIVTSRVYREGLEFIPMDLVETFFDLNRRFRENIGSVIKPGRRYEDHEGVAEEPAKDSSSEEVEESKGDDQVVEKFGSISKFKKVLDKRKRESHWEIHINIGEFHCEILCHTPGVIDINCERQLEKSFRELLEKNFKKIYKNREVIWEKPIDSPDMPEAHLEQAVLDSRIDGTDSAEGKGDDALCLRRTERNLSKQFQVDKNLSLFNRMVKSKPFSQKMLLQKFYTAAELETKGYISLFRDSVRAKSNSKKVGHITILPETSHTHKHRENIGLLIQKIKLGDINPSTVICLERKQFGNNLGMRDVIFLAKILKHNEACAGEKVIAIPEEISLMPIYHDAILYNEAKAAGISVVGVEDKDLVSSKGDSSHNLEREEAMAGNLQAINSSGRSARLLVGSSHVERLQAMTSRSKVSWTERLAVKSGSVDDVAAEI